MCYGLISTILGNSNIFWWYNIVNIEAIFIKKAHKFKTGYENDFFYMLLHSPYSI